MKKENENVMVYKNIGRRVLLLQEGGFIEEIKLEGIENLHGRKDYKLTMIGLEQLIPQLLEYPDGTEIVVKYMDKFGLDKEGFGIVLISRLYVITDVINRYLPTLTGQERGNLLTIIDPKGQLAKKPRNESIRTYGNFRAVQQLRLTAAEPELKSVTEFLKHILEAERVDKSMQEISSSSRIDGIHKFESSPSKKNKTTESTKAIPEVNHKVEDVIKSVKLFDSKTNKIIANYYDEIRSKLERYNIELKIDDKGKETKKYSLTRSYSAYSEPRKKRDQELVSKDIQELHKVIVQVPEPIKVLKQIANSIEALVVLPSEELENYYNPKSKTYNLIKTIDK
ncbi:MAG TPA: hypothetical protein VE130_09585 [Nitrososphaeraceae archaeon]|nr:hypothetical protein [Nitrososphaeraceae archaeon]